MYLSSEWCFIQLITYLLTNSTAKYWPIIQCVLSMMCSKLSSLQLYYVQYTCKLLLAFSLRTHFLHLCHVTICGLTVTLSLSFLFVVRECIVTTICEWYLFICLFAERCVRKTVVMWHYCYNSVRVLPHSFTFLVQTFMNTNKQQTVSVALTPTQSSWARWVCERSQSCTVSLVSFLLYLLWTSASFYVTFSLHLDFLLFRSPVHLYV